MNQDEKTFCAVFRKYPKDSPGGAEYQAYLICRELAVRGWEAHYIAYQSEENITIEDEGILVHRMKNGEPLRSAAVLPKNVRHIIQKCRSIDADFCYYRNLHDLLLLGTLKKAVDGTHLYNVSHNTQCQPILRSLVTRIKSNNGIKDILGEFRTSFFQTLLKLPNQIFAQSREQKNLLQRNRGIESSILGNGHQIPRSRTFKKASPPVVLWLASLKPWKRPRKFTQLAQNSTELDCKFVIVGRPADAETAKCIRKKSSELPNLVYEGGCDIQESNQYFKKSSIFVNTSIQEGFPNTFIQSWLHKVPVVSLGVDPDDILKQEDIGYVTDDVKSMKKKVEDLIVNKELRSNMGNNARNYAEENHSIQKIVDSLCEELK